MKLRVHPVVTSLRHGTLFSASFRFRYPAKRCSPDYAATCSERLLLTMVKFVVLSEANKLTSKSSQCHSVSQLGLLSVLIGP